MEKLRLLKPCYQFTMKRSVVGLGLWMVNSDVRKNPCAIGRLMRKILSIKTQWHSDRIVALQCQSP